MNRKEEHQINPKDEEILDEQIYNALIELGWLIPQTEDDVRRAEEAFDPSECPPLPPELTDPSRLFHWIDESLAENQEDAPNTEGGSRVGAAKRTASIIPFKSASQSNFSGAESSSVLPFLGMLQKITGETPSVIAKELDVTVPFLTLIVQYRESVTDRWRVEMIERAAVKWNVDRSMARRSLEHPTQQQIAASRNTPYSNKRISHREILRRSGLKPEAQKYWLALAEADKK